MNSRERVLTTLGFTEPDRVPFFEQGVASNVASEVLGREAHTGGGALRRDGVEAAMRGHAAYQEYVERYLEDWCALVDALDFDVVTQPWSGAGTPTKKLDEHTYVFGDLDGDNWSVQRYDPASDTFHTLDSAFQRGGVAAVEKQVKAALAAHEKRGKLTPQSFGTLQRLLVRFQGRRAVAGNSILAIPMQQPWLEALMDRPDLVEAHLRIAAERTCEMLEVQAQMGIDLVWGGGDLCHNGGPIYSPRHFRQLLVPRLKQIVDKCHGLGLKYVFRTDGVIWPIADALFVEAGCDGYGEIDAQAGMDLGDMRRRYPRVILWGNVNAGRTLTSGSPEDVIAETRSCIDKAARGGGYLLGSSNVIHAGVPTRNFLAMVETCRSYGRY